MASSFSTKPRSVVTFLLVSILPALVRAQLTFGNPAITTFSSSTTPSVTASPTSGVPQPTGYAPVAPSGNFISYYFILIAIGVCAVFLLSSFCIFRHVRRRRIATGRTANGDIVRDPEGRVFVYGRWRTAAAHNRREEGLNEAGEAPPPYIPGQPIAATLPHEGIPLQDMTGKPPDYDEQVSEEDLSMMRPLPTHPPPHRSVPERPFFASTEVEQGSGSGSGQPPGEEPQPSVPSTSGQISSESRGAPAQSSTEHAENSQRTNGQSDKPMLGTSAQNSNGHTGDTVESTAPAEGIESTPGERSAGSRVQ